MTAILREPLVHFLTLGALIFGLFLLFDDTPADAPRDRITVTESDAARLAAQFEATWRRAPNEAERARLLDAYVREEVLVREALALGLDRGDAVVRQRMAQKLTFLAESGAAAMPVSDAELAGHLETYPDRFARPPTLTFSHLLLRDDVTAERARQAVAAQGDLEDLARPSLLPERMGPSPAPTIDGTFGSGMFDQLAAQEVGGWTGPVQSAFGRHMVVVHARNPAYVPPLAEIRDQVELDWRATLRERLVAERIDALRARYEVILPDLSGAQP